MRYSEEENILYIDVREAVAYARRAIGAYPSVDEDEPEYIRDLSRSDSQEVELKHEFLLDEFKFSISGSVNLCEGGIELYFPLSDIREYKNREVQKQFRGEGYILAAMHLFNSEEKPSRVLIRSIYYVPYTGERKECEEEVADSKLYAFFNKCTKTLKTSASAEIDRVTVRIPSMKSVKFPYGRPREGQDEFIRTAYRTLAKGGTLYATAPTGTGKTVSALFPAVRAIGNRMCDKVFYLTPKTTTAKAAAECINKLCEAGAKIRAAIISAKDRICINGRVCKHSQKLCPTYRENKINEAVIALFDAGEAVVGAKEFERYAREYNVCPHELSLTYAELCDVIICDVNYLFDPDVYIRRFFSYRSNFAFLIDEAHNLCERAREMYSAEITLSEIELTEPLGELSALKSAAVCASDTLKKTILPLLRDETYNDKSGVPHAAYHTKDMPVEFYTVFSSLAATAEDELKISFSAKDEEKDIRIEFIRDYLYKTRKFSAATERFDSCYELFIFRDGDEVRLKIFCIDTGPIIKKRLEIGKGAIIFSGTLSPINYYKSVLGADSLSATLSVDSPFDRENVSVTIMDSITTRVSEREDSLLAVARVIAATLSAKRGNYMIFSSSYSYAKALSEAFRKKYPKIKTILQTPDMTQKEKEEFLAEFSKDDGTYLAAFCVLGGIFSEGIDLTGEKLIGAVIVGIGIPALSYEREAIAAYYEEKMEEGVRYAYLYPGMNKVLQAAGRVIRTESDRGVIVLIDDRFDDPIYKKIVPKIWSGMQFLKDPKELRARLDKFWAEE